jgi:ectoine hydroxylase-related dioxygenase (phytanoyl-CoA dioxygenase family)
MDTSAMLEFEETGALHLVNVVSLNVCIELAAKLNNAISYSAGTRNLLRTVAAEAAIRSLTQHPEIQALLPHDAVAVQCTLFEKSTQTNWLVPPHQDLSIPVAARVECADLTGWSVKEGVLFVQPPRAVLESCIALRLHLDPCSESDGPIRVVLGSHLKGVLQLAACVSLSPQLITVPARVGDVIALRPLTVHASSKSSGTSRRRVLQILFGPRALPFGLVWANAIG